MKSMSHSRKFLSHTLFLLFVGSLVTLMFVAGGCSCDGGASNGDGGVVDKKPKPKPKNHKMSIRFTQPKKSEVISGQVVLEAEVIDIDGIREVGFWVGNKLIESTQIPTANSPASAPRYQVQVASYFLPRGELTLTVKAEDSKGEFGEATINISSRERWAAAFGAGRVKQFLVRPDGHFYAWIHRTKEDLSRLASLGPYDKVGSTILTGTVKGGSSWRFVSLGQKFSPISLDSDGNSYMASRSVEKGDLKVVSLGPGERKWDSLIQVRPKWETALGKGIVTQAPSLQKGKLWILRQHPAEGGKPGTSSLLCLEQKTGVLLWNYKGEGSEQLEILRGPYLLKNDRAWILTRKAGDIKAKVWARLIDSKGKSLQKIDVSGTSEFNVVSFDRLRERLYIGLQKQKGTDTISSSVLCLDTKGVPCWKYRSGKNWPEKLWLGTKLLFVLQRLSDGAIEVAGLDLTSGKVKWKLPIKEERISDLAVDALGGCFIMTEVLDFDQDPESMRVRKMSVDGKVKWTFNNLAYSPKNWHYTDKLGGVFWMVVRNIEDRSEALGTKILALDRNGKRLYLFHEEKRRFEHLLFVAPNILFTTSYDPERDARIHNLVPRE